MSSPAIANRNSSGSGVVAAVPAVVALVAVVTTAALIHAFDLAARLAQTSDSAQGFVIAHAVTRGNLLLSGWHFPPDNYYFTDTIPYALLEWFVGSRPFLLTLVPALTYALFVFAALIISMRTTRPSTETFLGLSIVALILVAAAWTGPWNPLLLSDMHMATVLAAFVAIGLCARVAAGGRRCPLACAALPLVAALTVASDPFALVFAFGPALTVLAIDSWSKLSVPGARLAALLLVCGIACGAALPFMIAFAGGFTIENDIATQFIAAPLFGRNFAAVVSGTEQLFGIVPFGTTGLRAILLLALRCAAFACVVVTLVRILRRPFGRDVALLDRILCAGILIDLAACALSAQFAKGITTQNLWTGGPPMRFLVPSYLFGAVLAGRQIPGMLVGLPTGWLRTAAITSIPISAVAMVFFGGWLADIGLHPRWIDDNAPATAARWLKTHGLTQGVGEYWSANLVTAFSGNSVQVRSVVPLNGKLVPYVWAEDARWYTRPPQFMIWQDHNKTGVTSDDVRATFEICRTNFVAGYRIAVLAKATKTDIFPQYW